MHRALTILLVAVVSILPVMLMGTRSISITYALTGSPIGGISMTRRPTSLCGAVPALPRVTGSREQVLAGNAGAQIDYETRRVYASLKSDLQRSAEFADRVDTLQLGLAPYKHDYGGIATWFIFQARHYTGELHSGIETAALLRLFKGGVWIEAGVTNAGKVQAMGMFNF